MFSIICNMCFLIQATEDEIYFTIAKYFGEYIV